MKQMINTVVTDMLTALYQPFMFAVVLAVFFMFLYMYANCPKEAGRGYKAAIVSWLRQFKNSSLPKYLSNFPYFTGFPANPLVK